MSNYSDFSIELHLKLELVYRIWEAKSGRVLQTLSGHLVSLVDVNI